ncbi:MAG TPA: protein-L-isoaspartate(D-aspartate) O-methyltransferase [Terriglobales bacterium]|nr:protein-L-isoaspartate(D-aspartate) O-methyltransferase [Terriglobales bacterium]
MHAERQPDAFTREREEMVAFQVRARGITDERVLSAMVRVPRHEFVPADVQSQAHDDHPLPIGQEQTISQPYIVALMLEYLAIEPHSLVLEIGTGSGYQTALLAELAARVYSIERHRPLADSAAAVLAQLGYSNVVVLVGDGNRGLPEHAPYDRIIVSAAAHTIPPALFGQLREDGRMILPVGSEHAQELQLVRNNNGTAVVTSLEGCRFVPLMAGTPEQDLV